VMSRVRSPPAALAVRVKCPHVITPYDQYEHTPSRGQIKKGTPTSER